MGATGRFRIVGGVLVASCLLGGFAGAQVQVSVDKGTRYQIIEGFGASITAEYVIRPWKVRQGPFAVDIDLDSVGFYDSVITDLGVTAIRTDMRHSFSRSSGQYGVSDEIERLWYDLRKLKDAAQRHHEPLVYIGTVWSPPGWMKVSGTTACPGLPDSQCRLKDGYADTLADYLVRFVETLDDSGLPYYAVSFQNEPAFGQPFSSCVYTALPYRETLKSVGHAFDRAGLPQKLYGAEHMSHAFPSQFERAVRGDAEALGYMDAWAVHGYTDGVAADTGSFGSGSEDQKPLWMTETSGTGYGESWADWGKAMVAAKSILKYLRDGKISLWTWWTLQGGGCTVGEERGYAWNLHTCGRPNHKWHVSRHFFRFVRPGARQIASTSSDSDVLSVAFWHEGGQCLTIVLANMGTTSKTVNGITLNGGSAPATFERILSTATEQSVASTVGSSETITLPAQSVTTLVSGIYRGTDSLTAVHEPSVSPGAVRNPVARSGVRRLYGIDGRLVDRSGMGTLRNGRFATGNIYITVDTHGRATKVCGRPERVLP